MQSEDAVPPSRLLPLDLARLCAIILMVQGHTIDALLSVNYRQGAFFNTWLFVRGLTAPTFLLLSGLSFGIATTRRWQAFLYFSKPVIRRLRRFLGLVISGYAMHLPARSISGFRELDALVSQTWLRVDVLQCIGVSLATLQLLVVIIRRQSHFSRLVLTLAFVVILSTPLLWNVTEASHLPTCFTDYLTSKNGSLFPLFPWAGYLFLGAGIGVLFVRHGFTVSRLLVSWAGFVGLFLILLGLVLDKLPISLYPKTDFWRTSPDLFLIRTGCVFLLLTIAALMSRLVPSRSDWIHTIARQSLMIYFVHVCVVYSSVWNPGLRDWVGASLGPLASATCASFLVIFMVFLALIWFRAKQRIEASGRLRRYSRAMLATCWSPIAQAKLLLSITRPDVAPEN